MVRRCVDVDRGDNAVNKSEKILSFVLVCVLAIVMLALKAMAADVAGSYGVAEFWNPVHIPRDNLVERWILDPGVSGDLAGGIGDYETWTGAEGGCADCPTGITCDCTTSGGDVVQETVEIFKNGFSARLDASGLYHSVLFWGHDFTENTAYQIEICYRGEDGTEDIGWTVANGALTESFDFTTDTWTVPPSMDQQSDIGTTWTCSSSYVTVGATAKSNYFLVIGAMSADGTYIYVDNAKLRRFDRTGIIGEQGTVLSVPVTSDPRWDDSQALQFKQDGGQVTSRGMTLDGSGDYMIRFFDDGTFDETGNFSVATAVQLDTLSGTQIMAAKDNGGANRNWSVYNNAGAALFIIWDASGTSSNTSLGSAFTAGALSRTVSTYEFVTDGTSDMWTYSNNLTAASQLNANGPVRTLSNFLGVGSNSIGGSKLTGQMVEMAYYSKTMSTIEVSKWINPYFPGTSYGDGFYVEDCSQAASHATCSLEACRDGTPHACHAEGTGVMSLFGQYVELCDDNSFETLTGDDSDPNFTNWTESETAGDGSASITAYRHVKKHGEVSARMALTGTTSEASLTSACETVSSSTDYHVGVFSRKLSGTADLRVQLIEYSDGACSSALATTSVNASDVSGQWTWYGGEVTTNGSASSAEMVVTSYQSASDIVVDLASLKAASYYTPPVHNEGAGSTTYNKREYVLNNPLARRSSLAGEDLYESGYCISQWVYTDWSGDDDVTHGLFQVDGTAGNNNQIMAEKRSNNIVYLWVWDSGGTSSFNTWAVTDTNWTAGDWKYVEVCTDNAGSHGGHFYNRSNSTWYDLGAKAGAGTGIHNAQSADFQAGHQDGSNFCDCYQPMINVVPYSSIYPQAGFNDGVPPVNGVPY